MNNGLKKNISKKRVLFYIIWVLSFAVISIVAANPEKLTWGMVIIAIIISIILSIPATHYVFKAMDKQKK